MHLARAQYGGGLAENHCHTAAVGKYQEDPFGSRETHM